VPKPLAKCTRADGLVLVKHLQEQGHKGDHRQEGRLPTCRQSSRDQVEPPTNEPIR
jgi:hypothetical protein